MNYTDNAKGCLPCEELRPRESLRDLMAATENTGLEVRSMAERIHENLFGEEKCRESKDGSPNCFRDALELHRTALEQTATTLSRICSMLGI